MNTQKGIAGSVWSRYGNNRQAVIDQMEVVQAQIKKIVPQADAKSASMGWFFDPGFIQNVQRVSADVENPSMESIDSVLFALREMGYIRVANTCEHGFSVDECVTGLCELQAENAAIRARVARLEEALPDPNKLELLARWIDLNFEDGPNPEVLNDYPFY